MISLCCQTLAKSTHLFRPLFNLSTRQTQRILYPISSYNKTTTHMHLYTCYYYSTTKTPQTPPKWPTSTISINPSTKILLEKLSTLNSDASIQPILDILPNYEKRQQEMCIKYLQKALYNGKITTKGLLDNKDFNNIIQQMPEIQVDCLVWRTKIQLLQLNKDDETNQANTQQRQSAQGRSIRSIKKPPSPSQLQKQQQALMKQITDAYQRVTKTYQQIFTLIQTINDPQRRSRSQLLVFKAFASFLYNYLYATTDDQTLLEKIAASYSQSLIRHPQLRQLQLKKLQYLMNQLQGKHNQQSIGDDNPQQKLTKQQLGYAITAQKQSIKNLVQSEGEIVMQLLAVFNEKIKKEGKNARDQMFDIMQTLFTEVMASYQCIPDLKTKSFFYYRIRRAEIELKLMKGMKEFEGQDEVEEGQQGTITDCQQKNIEGQNKETQTSEPTQQTVKDADKQTIQAKENKQNEQQNNQNQDENQDQDEKQDQDELQLTPKQRQAQQKVQTLLIQNRRLFLELIAQCYRSLQKLINNKSYSRQSSILCYIIISSRCNSMIFQIINQQDIKTLLLDQAKKILMMLTDVGNNRKQLMEIIGKIIADCMQEHKIKMKVFMNQPLTDEDIQPIMEYINENQQDVEDEKEGEENGKQKKLKEKDDKTTKENIGKKSTEKQKKTTVISTANSKVSNTTIFDQQKNQGLNATKKVQKKIK